jgi:hypothetical protein
VQNLGHAAWPAEIKLVFGGGNRDLLTETEFAVPACEPGQSVDVTAVIDIPKSHPVGQRAIVFFRLAESRQLGQRFFGQRLLVNVQVERTLNPFVNAMDKSPKYPPVSKYNPIRHSRPNDLARALAASRETHRQEKKRAEEAHRQEMKRARELAEFADAHAFAISQLESMGFALHQIVPALQRARGDVTQALTDQALFDN